MYNLTELNTHKPSDIQTQLLQYNIRLYSFEGCFFWSNGIKPLNERYYSLIDAELDGKRILNSFYREEYKDKFKDLIDGY